MDLLFTHEQEKKDRKSSSISECNLKLFSDSDKLIYTGIFDLDYHRYGARKHITFEHTLLLNLNNGDIEVSYKLINDKLTDDKIFKTSSKTKKNDFKLLYELSENGFERGEKRFGYWGVKYKRATEKILNLIYVRIKDRFKSDYGQQKIEKGDYQINQLFDMIVDFHLEVKNIKGHDGVYFDIQHVYPKKKWLIKNDNKFLPSVLDGFNIKSKYLIGELNKNVGKSIHIESLNYLCKLFGDNYIDYIKQIKWEDHCYDLPPNKKVHRLKNESEKSSMVSLINKWEKNTLRPDSIIYNLNKLLSIRDMLEEKNYDLKFKAKNDSEFENTMEIWSGIKIHLSRGYKLKYNLPDDFIDLVESTIEINGETFTPKLLVSEEDFRFEGFSMKNCMAKQFPNGAIYLYFSLQHKRKKVNLQYRKGELIQSYGKANTKILDIFNDAINILSDRLKKYRDITWKKEKYDILTR